MLKYLFLVLFLSGSHAFACSCIGTNGVATKENTGKYDMIFLGKVDSVSVCNKKSIAYFRISELFKGEPSKPVPIYFDCTTSCQLSMNKGETWLIYASFFKYGKLETVFCSRTRKFFEDDGKDYYKAGNQLSFQEELNFLRKNYDSKTITESKNGIETANRELVKPGGYRVLGLLFISLAGLGLIYFLLHKFFK